VSGCGASGGKIVHSRRRLGRVGRPLTFGVSLDSRSTRCDVWRCREFRRHRCVTEVETFAIGKSIRELPRLRKIYGRGRWRKRTGRATVRLPDGTTRVAELHWYEATGFGRKEFKIKRYLD
jgi:hypothetical protein